MNYYCKIKAIYCREICRFSFKIAAKIDDLVQRMPLYVFSLDTAKQLSKIDKFVLVVFAKGYLFSGANVSQGKF